MILSLWKKAVVARMTREARRAKPSTLACEPLEDRTTPAAQAIIATTVEFGAAPVVSVYDAATHQLKFTVQAYESTFTGGVRVAVGDVNGDGVEDLITGTGIGGGAVVKVFSGVDGHLLSSFFAGDETNRGGATVAAADFDGDGKADIVVGAIQNGTELVQVIKGTTGAVLEQFRPFNAPIEGVTVAAGDYNGDGTPDVVVGAGIGGSPRVTVLDGKSGAVLLNTFAFESTARGGVQVAAGDLNGDGRADVVAAPGPGGGPRVVAFAGGTGDLIHSFFAYSDTTSRNGVQMSVFDVDGNGTNDIVTANGPGQAPDLKAFDGTTLAPVTITQFAGLPFAAVTVAAATAPTAFSAESPPAGAVGSPFSYTFVANGVPTPTYAVTSGTLPAGLTLGANGVLSGTPTAAGTSTFVVTATNRAGSLASSSITLTVAAGATAPTAFSAETPTAGLVGEPYSYTFVADGAPAPTYAVSSGALPAGLTLGTNGVLSGTPTAAGTSTFVVTATNLAGSLASSSITLTVATPAPAAPTGFSAESPTDGVVGSPYSYTFVADGVPTPTYAVSSGALPTGLTLGTNGVLSGTPTAAGTSTFVVTATNSVGSLASSSITLNVVEFSAANSTVDADADGGTLAKGDTTGVSIIAMDSSGNPITGLTAADIKFGVTGGSTGGGSFDPSTFVYLGGGEFNERFTAGKAGTVTFTATVAGVTVTDPQSVTITG